MVQRFFFIIVLSSLLIACIQSEQDITLNPDGSGKIVYRVQYPIIDLGGEDKTPEQQAIAEVQEMFQDSRGVDAWADVSYEVLGGQMHFKGIAYFSDFNALELHQGGLQGGLAKSSLAIDDQGRQVLTVKIDTEDEAKEQTEKTTLSEQEVDKKLKEMQSQYKSSRSMMVGVMSEMRLDATYHLPGKLISASNFQSNDDGSVQLVFAGQQMIDLFDQLMSDEDWMREQISKGINPIQDMPMSEQELNKALFGQAAPIQAIFDSASQEQFDYKTELASVQQAYQDLQKSFNMVPEASAPADASGFEDVQVGGVRLVYLSHDDGRVRPFGQEPSFSVALLARFPGTVIEVEEGELHQAIADDGSDLLPESEWARRIHFPSLADDNKTVGFDVSMRLPEKNVSGFKLISGVISYIVGEGVKEIDVGITSFSEGIDGSELGAVIKSIGPNPYGDGFELVLSLEVGMAKIASIRFLDDDGNLVAAKQGGYSGSGSSVSIDYISATAYPERGRIIVDLHDNLQKHKALFEIKDIDILGRAR